MNDPAAQRRYLDGEYRKANPTWDQEDSPWKASLVRELIVEAGIPAASIAEIGCGAGGVLAELRRAFPQARLSGFDISPDAAQLWRQHAAADVEYTLGDFFQLAGGLRYDVILVLDVLEHLADPMEFLARLRPRAGHFILHIPLDLSAFSVLRETPLLYVRRKVGHIHYYTRSLALALLEECGYEVREARYTGAAFNAPQRTWKTRVASLARRAVYALGKDLGVRLLGGETLLVLARARP
jgi:SAM-dependent methyltransferase